MKREVTLTIRSRLAWWVRPYLAAVDCFAKMFGLQPDVEKVARVAAKGIRMYCGEKRIN